jgi:hypothetical protein
VKANVFILFLVMLTSMGYAQRRQLVLLKGQRVIQRYLPGDDIRIKVKGNDQIINSYVNNLTDTSVLVHTTDIPFHKIERIYFHRANFANKLGAYLTVAGTGLFLIDQINVVLVNGDEPSINDGVAKTSLGMIAVGLPMMLIKKKYIKPSYKFRLLSVDETSLFYLHPPTISPYLR